jgi:hypothetical protein
MSKFQHFYEPIGELVIMFSNLEHMVSMTILALMEGNPSVNMCLVAEMSFSKRVDALSSIAPFYIKDDALLKELAEIIKHVGESEAHRNTMIHSGWSYSTNTGELSRVKTTAKRKKGLDFGFQPASVDEVKAATNHIKTSLRQMVIYTKKLQAQSILRLRIFEDPYAPTTV